MIVEGGLKTLEKKRGGIIWNGLLALQRNIMFYFSLIIAVSITIGAMLRYVFKTNLYGMEEIISIFAFWLYFVGGAYGAFEDSHIKADVVSSFVTNQKLQSTLIAFSTGVTAFFCFVGIYLAWGMLSFSFLRGTQTPVWRIPLWIPQGAVFLGFVLMALYFSIHFKDHLKKTKEIYMRRI